MIIENLFSPYTIEHRSVATYQIVHFIYMISDKIMLKVYCSFNANEEHIFIEKTITPYNIIKNPFYNIQQKVLFQFNIKH